MSITITPNISESSNGEVLTGFTAKPSPHLHHGMIDPNNSDYIETDKGDFKHVMSETELSTENDPYEQYFDAVIESKPNVREALEWAAGHYPEDFTEKYNKALHGNDLDTFNEYLDKIVNDFEASGEKVEVSEEEPKELEDELSAEDTKLFDNIVSQALSEEPQGEEQADKVDNLAREYLAKGNECGAAILAANAAFDRGSMTAEQAIEYVIDNYDIQEIKKNWFELEKHYA